MAQNTNLQLERFQIITGYIKCETGLHIGGAAEKIEIGGMDNPIIKHPITDLPYIPGSSIKGKMRSLLEWKMGLFESDGEVHKWCNNKNCPICRIFGTTAEEAPIGPTRLIVRDAMVSGYIHCPIDKNCPYKEKETENDVYKPCEEQPECSYGQLEYLRQKTGLLYAEDKFENTINRLTARANPRQMERVPAGISFDFELVFREFRFDEATVKDGELLETVKLCLKMLEMDALGGSGSRGYGKIKFENLKLNGNELNLNEIEIEP